MDRSVYITRNSPGCGGVIQVIKDCDGLLCVFDGSESLSRSFDDYWHNADNWRNKLVPNQNSYVIIPSNKIIVVKTEMVADCDELILENNAKVVIEPNAKLNILSKE